MKVLSNASAPQDNYLKRMSGAYLQMTLRDPSLSASAIDGETLDLILSLPSPRKEKEFVDYLISISRANMGC